MFGFGGWRGGRIGIGSLVKIWSYGDFGWGSEKIVEDVRTSGTSEELVSKYALYLGSF